MDIREIMINDDEDEDDDDDDIWQWCSRNALFQEE